MWHKIILPRLGKHRVADVTYNEVDELHRDITRIRKTPVRATVWSKSRGAFNLAIRWHWRHDNPARGVQRNQEEKRDRYLGKAEIMALARALNEHPEVTSVNAIKLLMLTGARRGEVLGATWDMFDLEQGVWVKPSAHTKQRRIHRVPLSSPALDLLESMRAEAKNQFVFSGPEGKPLTDLSEPGRPFARRQDLSTAFPNKPDLGRQFAIRTALRS